jgi:hypothetical protein
MEDIMTEQNDGFVPVEAIFAGRRETKDNKVAIVFYLLNEKRLALFEDGRSKFRAVIGGVYVLAQKGESFRLSDKYVRPSNDPQVAEWQAADEAVDVAIRARKLIAQQRKDAKASILRAVEPFREEYRRTDRIGRLALEVVLLHALRQGTIIGG